MTRKQMISCIGFILAACVVLYLLCDLFEMKNSFNSDKRFNTYRSLNEDTVDVMMIGSSGVDRYWIAAKAYEEYGVTGYTLSTDEQPSWLYEHLIEEIYAYQNPELLIIDMRPFAQDNIGETEMDAKARRVLDSLEPLSLNRIKAGLKTMKVMHETFEDQPRFDISYLLSVVKYHEMWSKDNYSIEKNLFNRQHKYLGYYINKKRTVWSNPQEKTVYETDYYEPLDSVAEQSFYDLIEYLKNKDVKVLFVTTPKYTTTVETGRLNTLMDMLEKEGLDYINFCETDENGDFLYDLNLDPQHDFYDKEHVNYYGAEKFTSVFAAYLDENYDLPDRRDDAAVKEQWDGVYNKIQKKINRMETKAAQSLIEEGEDE